MNCIVTAGPTYEPLDEVRRLTNFSTGRLGSELAAFLADHGHGVTLLLGHYATYHGRAKGRKTELFTTTKDLATRLHTHAHKPCDAIFHAAAVSDFGFGRVFHKDRKGDLKEVQSAKISTSRGELLAELVPTPKIIAHLREWYPRACVVGWKYEVEGTRQTAIAKGCHQVAAHQTQACVVNGRAYGEGYGLVTATGHCLHYATTTELFRALEQIALIGSPP